MKRTIALAALSLVLVGCGDLSEVSDSLSEEEKNDTPSEVTEGKAFTHDGFKANKGWKVTNKRYEGGSIKGLKVTNTADKARTAQLTFRFYKGSENLGEIECSSNEMQAGETSKLDCFSLDQKFPKKWQTIKVSDMW